LKRPFDDHTQPRIRLEGEAVLTLLAAPAPLVELLRAPAHDLENDQNPLPWRAAIVRQWLLERRSIEAERAPLLARTTVLMSLGFRGFDALHLAFAETGRADAFATTDVRLAAVARRASRDLRVRVADPVTLVRELFP
jgi:hypothetical protein